MRACSCMQGSLGFRVLGSGRRQQQLGWVAPVHGRGEGLEPPAFPLSCMHAFAAPDYLHASRIPPCKQAKPAAPAVNVPAAVVKALRDQTGAGMMDCKKALAENGGDIEASVDWLRKKGLCGADKKAGRVAAEGAICQYIHPGRAWACCSRSTARRTLSPPVTPSTT